MNCAIYSRVICKGRHTVQKSGPSCQQAPNLLLYDRRSKTNVEQDVNDYNTSDGCIQVQSELVDSLPVSATVNPDSRRRVGVMGRPMWRKEV